MRKKRPCPEPGRFLTETLFGFPGQSKAGAGNKCIWRIDTIVTAVEKKHPLLFNKCGDDSPHRPQSGLAVDFIVSTSGFYLTRQRLRRCLKIGICRFSTVLTISAEHPVGPGPLTRPFPRQIKRGNGHPMHAVDFFLRPQYNKPSAFHRL